MPGYTTNYNLIKPLKSENYDVDETTRTNMDMIDTFLFEKIDKTPGKGLSSNDFTTQYKNKIDNISKTYSFAGTVDDFEDLALIESKKIGDVYHVSSESMDYAWNGTEWCEVAPTKGDAGTGIEEIVINESIEDDGNNVIIIKLSDETQKSFNIKNGSKGSQGVGISSISITEINDDFKITVLYTNNDTQEFTIETKKTKKAKMQIEEDTEKCKTLTIPLYYKVGTNELDVYLNGKMLIKASTSDNEGNYYEIGENNNISNQIKLTNDWNLEEGDILEFVTRGEYSNDTE